MADIGITKFRVKVPTTGTEPFNPGTVGTVDPNPVNPPGSSSFHNPVTLGTPANGLSLAGQQLSLGSCFKWCQHRSIEWYRLEYV